MSNPIRARMTQRATIERNTQTDANEYGHVGPAEWEPLADEMPCFLYSRSSRGQPESVTPDRAVVVEQMALMVPLGADVTERDRVNGVEDRSGNVLLAGVQNIRSVMRHHTHLELLIQGAA